MSEQAAVGQRSENSDDQSPAPSAGRAGADSTPTPRRRSPVSMGQVRGAAAAGRDRMADLVWLAAALCAAVLAIGALLVVLGANADNPVVQWFSDGASWLAGPLGTVFEFEKQSGAPDVAMNSFVNWAIAAIVFLVAGRLAHRLLRPSS